MIFSRAATLHIIMFMFFFVCVGMSDPVHIRTDKSTYKLMNQTKPKSILMDLIWLKVLLNFCTVPYLFSYCFFVGMSHPALLLYGLVLICLLFFADTATVERICHEFPRIGSQLPAHKDSRGIFANTRGRSPALLLHSPPPAWVFSHSM